MKYYYKILSAVVLMMLLALGASAQVIKFRISEVMVDNTDNYVDHYGGRSSWIEVYNTYGATIDMGGCYLSNDPKNLTLYQIPKGDLGTKVGPRQNVVFFADDRASHGTFHLNFKLTPGIENVVIFSDNSGHEVDRIIIPATLPVNRSFGRIDDSKALVGVLEKTTPNALNVVKIADAASQNFKRNDPLGLGMSVTAMSVVFSALVLLYLVFKYAGKIHVKNNLKNKEMSLSNTPTTVPSSVENEITGEVCAAIGLALQQMQDSDHDHEVAILTFDMITKRYSPWSSKIHTLRQVPNVKR